MFSYSMDCNYLVNQASTEPNLYPLYMEYLVGTGDFHLTGLVLQEAYNHTGFALTTKLLFELLWIRMF